MITWRARLLGWGGGLLAGAILSAGIYSGADALALHALADDAARYDVPAELTVAASGAITLRLDPGARHVSVVTHGASGFRAPTYSTADDGGSRSISYSCPSFMPGTCATELEVTVPPGVALTLSSDTGDVTAEGRGVLQETSLRASSDTGQVRVEGWSGPVEASSDNGGVRLDSITGAVAAKSAVGSVRVTNVRGSVDTTSSTGELYLASISGDISARTDAGDIGVDTAPDAPAAAVDAHSDTGEVFLDAPTNPASDISVSLRSKTGDIRYQE